MLKVMLIGLFKSNVGIGLKVGYLLGLMGFPILLSGFVLVLLNGFKIISYAGYIGPLFFAGAMLAVIGLVIVLGQLGKN